MGKTWSSPWTTKVAGALIIGAIEGSTAKLTESSWDVVVKMSLLDKFIWGILIFAFLFGIFLLLSPIIERRLKEIAEKGKKTTDKASSSIFTSESSKEGIVTALGFEFFPTRDDLAKKHPISGWIELKDPIWGLWNAGTSAYTSSVMKEARIQRLILPHPSIVDDVFAKAVGKNKEGIISDIKELAREALERERQLSTEILHWHKELIGNTITIGNPESLVDQWIILETLIASTRATKRPSIRIKKIDPFIALFDELMKVFNYYWINSQHPTKQELLIFGLNGIPLRKEEHEKRSTESKKDS